MSTRTGLNEERERYEVCKGLKDYIKKREERYRRQEVSVVVMMHAPQLHAHARTQKECGRKRARVRDSIHSSPEGRGPGFTGVLFQGRRSRDQVRRAGSPSGGYSAVCKSRHDECRSAVTGTAVETAVGSRFAQRLLHLARHVGSQPEHRQSAAAAAGIAADSAGKPSLAAAGVVAAAAAVTSRAVRSSRRTDRTRAQTLLLLRPPSRDVRTRLGVSGRRTRSRGRTGPGTSFGREASPRRTGVRPP
jgi:hypothetical protein